jgi:hypothetical protein
MLVAKNGNIGPSTGVRWPSTEKNAERTAAFNSQTEEENSMKSKFALAATTALALFVAGNAAQHLIMSSSFSRKPIPTSPSK